MRKIFIISLLGVLILTGCNNIENNQFEQTEKSGEIINSTEEMNRDNEELNKINWSTIKNGEEKNININEENVTLKLDIENVGFELESYLCYGDVKLTNTSDNGILEFDATFSPKGDYYVSEQDFDEELEKENFAINISKIKDYVTNKEYFIINNDNGYDSIFFVLDEKLNLIMELNADTSHWTAIYKENDIKESVDTIYLYDNQIIYYDAYGDIVTKCGDNIEYIEKSNIASGDERILLKRKLTINNGKVINEVLESYTNYAIGQT